HLCLSIGLPSAPKPRSWQFQFPSPPPSPLHHVGYLLLNHNCHQKLGRPISQYFPFIEGQKFHDLIFPSLFWSSNYKLEASRRVSLLAFLLPPIQRLKE